MEAAQLDAFRSHGWNPERKAREEKRQRLFERFEKRQFGQQFNTTASQRNGSCGESGRGVPDFMTTLETGATGFVGSHVARQLVGAGARVRVLVRSGSKSSSLDGLNVERVEGDLRDSLSLDRAMKGVRQVFHVAADYRLWARDPNDIYKSNVDG